MEIGLAKLLLCDGVSLRIVADTRLNLARGKIWAIIDNQEQWRIIPSEQIIAPTDKVILFEDRLPA